jgi:c-di-GMP-binding flagellar brake protein YcgR
LSGILPNVGVTSERRRNWRTSIELACHLHRRTGKLIEGHTVDIGPGGMRVHTIRPLAIDETLEFELVERGRIHGRARVLREQAYRVYALRFEKLGDEARAEIADLAQPRDSATTD